MGGWTKRFLASLIIACLCSRAFAAPPPPPGSGGAGERPANVAAAIKAIVNDEMIAIEKELAARMMRRPDAAGDRRTRLELEIDLRIIQRGVLGMVWDAKPETQEQAAAWLRSRQLAAVMRGLEDALAQDAWTPTPTQRDATAVIHKASYSIAEIKNVRDLDDFCKNLAVGIVNVVNAKPVDARVLAAMRPKPLAGAPVEVTHDGPPTLAELSAQVPQLASISVPLRQQLQSLAQEAAQEKEGGPLYQLLSQSISLARGLQSNTAVGAQSRTQIESQLAEGIALYSDPRTRDAGKSRIDSLAQYRQMLGRIGKMSLTKTQMDQFGPALTWAQANGDQGLKLLATIEKYIDTCAKWDAAPRDTTVLPSVKRALDDLMGQFAKQRAGFMADAARVGPTTPADLEGRLDELKRLAAVVDDVAAAGVSIDIINSFKIRPMGTIEKKVTTFALAAAVPTRTPARNDADKYLDSVHNLGDLAKQLNSRSLTDVPPAVLQAWAGGKLDAVDAKWKSIIVDLAGGLIAGSIDLDKAKVARLGTVMALTESLKTAAHLEAALPKTAPLVRWVDWGLEPAILGQLLATYRDSTANAFASYALDNQDGVERWSRNMSRYLPLIAIIIRDAEYAEPCSALPIGFPGDLARLATPLEGVPFGTERFMNYGISFWTIFEKQGDYENADRISQTVGKRLARDLRINTGEDNGGGRRRR